VVTTPFAGQVDAISASTTWTFAGPTATVTTVSDQVQVLVGVASAIVEFNNSVSSVIFDYAFCYQDTSGGPLTIFSGSLLAGVLQPNNAWVPFSISAAQGVGPGTWNIGLCVYSSEDIATGSVSGWVQVTD
jgi:hypothetical protein